MPGPQRVPEGLRSCPSDIDARAPEGVLATIPKAFPRRVQPPHSAPKDNTRDWSVPGVLPKENGRNGIARRRSCAVGAETPSASASPGGGAELQTGYPSIAVRRLRRRVTHLTMRPLRCVRGRAAALKAPEGIFRQYPNRHVADTTGSSPEQAALPRERVSPGRFPDCECSPRSAGAHAEARVPMEHGSFSRMHAPKDALPVEQGTLDTHLHHVPTKEVLCPPPGEGGSSLLGLNGTDACCGPPRQAAAADPSEKPPRASENACGTMPRPGPKTFQGYGTASRSA